MFNFEESLSQLIKNGNEKGALSLMKQQITENPNDIELRIRYSLFIQGVPFENYPEALDVLSEVLNVESLNIRAIILKAYIEDIHQGEISDWTYELIEKCIANRKQEEYGYFQLFMVKALYYRYKNPEQYELALKAANENDLLSSTPCFLLGEYYEGIEEKKSEKWINKAIDNVTLIYDDNYFFNPTSFEEFINESIRGVHLSKVNYEGLLEKVNKLL